MHEAYAEPFGILLSLYMRLVNSQAGKQVPAGDEWFYDGQTLAIKIFRHLITLAAVGDGARVPLDATGCAVLEFVDHPSVQVLARTALESYLVFYFIYCCGDRDLSRFRHMAWHIGGLMDRQKLHPLNDETREKMAVELAQIEELRAEIRAMPLFQARSANQRARILEGDWRPGCGVNWPALGRIAGFHENYFANVYSYLCGSAHASYASILQIGQALELKEQSELANSIVGVGVVLMAHFALAYPLAYPAAQAVLDADAIGKQKAETWKFDAERMEPLWGKKAQPPA